MQHTQHAVAILHIIHNDAKGADVIQISELQLFATHFVENAVNVLGATRNLRTDVLDFKCMIQSRNGTDDKIFALDALFIQPFGNFFVSHGFGKTKSQILQLPFDLPHPQTIGERRIQQQRFLRHTHRARHFILCIITQGL